MVWFAHTSLMQQLNPAKPQLEGCDKSEHDHGVSDNGIVTEELLIDNSFPTTKIARQSSILGALRSTVGWLILSNGMKLGVGIWATRYLEPKDYALLATVLAIQGFAIGMTAFNMSSELVRAKKIDKDDLSVAWTCDAIRNLVIWSSLFLLAPIVAGWLQRPDAVIPLRVSISVLLVSLLISPRLVELRRSGRFGALGMIDGLTSIGYAIVTVTFVLIFKNYWALIIAGIFTPLFQAVISHALVPWRPRLHFDLARAKPMAKLGIVLLALTWIAALCEHGMVFLISNAVTDNELGFYNRALTFSYSLAFVASGVFWRVAYPIYSRHSIEGGNPLADASKAQAWILLVALPLAAIGIVWRDFWIGSVLGVKWQPMAEIWSLLIIAGTLLLANAPFEAAFQASRREGSGMLINGMSAAVQLISAWMLLPILGLNAAGVGIVAAACFSVVCFRIAARRHRGILTQAEL